MQLIFNNPDVVLSHILKHFVIPNMRYDYDVYLENTERDAMIAMHSDPVLPDDVDQYGNLPYLRCGWKKCGKVFRNRDQLLNHVSKFIPHAFVHRFHLKCGRVLAANPDMSLQQFMTKARDSFDAYKRRYVLDKELTAYYNQFRPIFKKDDVSKDDDTDFNPDVVSNGNPYYWDQCVTVRKNFGN